jgi:RHS repeat-associated protein
MQRDPGGRSLYLAGAEFRVATGATAASASRYYAHDVAGLVASRQSATGLNWQAMDHQGTSQIAVRASDGALLKRRTAPFGTARGASPIWPHPYGFVGGEADRAGTVHLGAREYDAAIGRFISADPIFDVEDPQSYQGYAYADNTPVTGSDVDGLRVCLEVCGGPDDKWMQQDLRDKAKAKKKAEAEAKRNNCPRNIPREDCVNPRGVKNTKTYKHGTVVTVLNNGMVLINGYVLPEGHPDPYKLAEATDEAAPEVARTQNGRGDFENVIRGVAVGCERMGRGCSLTFRRTVVTDLDAEQNHTFLPSYVGRDTPYAGEPDELPETPEEVLDLAETLVAEAHATGTEKLDLQRKLAAQGRHHNAGYHDPHDPIMDYAVACVMGTAVGVVAEGVASVKSLVRVKTVGRLAKGATVVGCIAGVIDHAVKSH